MVNENHNISLIEDHHQALKVWRRKGFTNLDLVHIDAHIDFGFQPAKPIKRIINEAGSIKDLKRNLEYSLAFLRYERDFDKQTNIGNYIYPAMSEGIVKDFYWVIPGGLKEFKKSVKLIKGMLKSFSRQNPYHSRYTLHATRYTLKDGIILTELLDRKFVICILEKLPILKQKVLLDIDTDFLVVDSLLNANNTSWVGKRKPWIESKRLVQELNRRIIHPTFITIAYSVNGGYTPMRYKVLGDELAYSFAPRYFNEDYRKKIMASNFFKQFEAMGRREDYQKAVRMCPTYKAADNNYGPLYLAKRKFSQAEKEFLKVSRVDPQNPYPLLGLGKIALEKKDAYPAKRFFSSALRLKEDSPEGLSGLAQAEFRLKNFKKAKVLFYRYQALRPLEPDSYYFLGCIYEKEKNFKEAVAQYQDAMRLGLNNINLLNRLIKVSFYDKTKGDIIKFVSIKYREFKKGFERAKRLSLKRSKKFKGLLKTEKKMIALEKRLQNLILKKEG